jgi:hypothetical protein
MAGMERKEDGIMRKFWDRKRNRVLILAAFSCLFVSCVCLRLFYGLNEQDRDQSAAKRWQSGDQAFAQFSVFFSPQEGWGEQDRKSLLSQLRMAFQENSITNTDGTEDGLLKDCYSCETTMTLTNGSKSVQAAVTATGGDFFYFHPQIWLSGYAYSDEDVMQDRIVLDKELAWSLFGSENVEGMPLTIEEKTYYVAGVVAQAEDSAAKAAYGEKNRAWISYSMLNSEQEEAAAITAYEIVMPNPVDGWGESQLTQVLSPEEKEIVLVENSGRADFLRVFEEIGEFTKMGVVEKAVKYPYWENAARIRDCKREILLVLACLGVLYPCGLCVVGIRIGCRGISGRIKRMRKK